MDENGGAFRQDEVLAGQIIDQNRNLAVRVERQEGLGLLLALAHIHRLEVVGEAHLLQRDQNLDAVGRGECMNFDHLCLHRLSVLSLERVMTIPGILRQPG
jgi:hypothetical protein